MGPNILRNLDNEQQVWVWDVINMKMNKSKSKKAKSNQANQKLRQNREFCWEG